MRLYIGIVKWLARRIEPTGVRYLLDPPAFQRACIQAWCVCLLALMPLMVPGQVRPQDFERLKAQIEGQHDRLHRVESGLDLVRDEVSNMKVSMAGNLVDLTKDVSAMKWIGGILCAAFAACLPLAFKAGRWYQKTEHISGERPAIK